MFQTFENQLVLHIFYAKYKKDGSKYSIFIYLILRLTNKSKN